MNTKTRTVLTGVAAAVVLVAVPTTAQAADYTMWSTSGRSYVWYNDAGNQITVCDMVSDDGIGAHGVVIGNQPRRERVVYNSCETIHNITDGWWQDVTICDWVYGDYISGRHDAYCRHTQLLA